MYRGAEAGYTWSLWIQLEHEHANTMESSQFAGISRRPLVISLLDHTQQLMSSGSNKLYDMLIVLAFKYPAKPGISPYRS